MSILPARLVEKPWGKTELPPPFTTPPGARIGEIWFEPPVALHSLLVKYIFTDAKLSVQVHPSDAQTLAESAGRQGKEECWLVLDAMPGARLGVGFGQALDVDTLRTAALDGSIEDMLVWHPVKAGDFFYIPANTVHAIGAGISLIEVQQNSDITYRLYDYGRARELHLEQALTVASPLPHDPALRRHIPDHGEVMLVQGPLFRLLRYDGPLSANAREVFGHAPFLVIPSHGDATVDDESVSAGGCALATDLDSVSLNATARGLIAQPIAEE